LANERIIEGIIEGVFGGVSGGVKNKYKTLILAVLANEGTRIPFLSEKINEPEKNVERYIKQLRTYGLVRFQGSTKTGGYYLTYVIKKKLK
jgi:ATP-dependent DNA helicase RecG